MSPLYRLTIISTVLLARINPLLSSPCPTLTLLLHRLHPRLTSKPYSIMPWIRTKSAQRRICVIIHSPSSYKTANLRIPFLLFLNNNWISPGVPMSDGLNGSIRRYTCFLPFPRQLEPLAWYEIRSSEISALIFIWQAFSPTTIVFAGVGVLLSVCILNNIAGAVVTHGSIRQLRMFEQVTTLLSTYSSEWKSSFDVSRSTQKRNRLRK